MWEIYEGPKARKSLKKLPHEILKRYEKWKDIVMISGPGGLRNIRGFNDEKLHGIWEGFRSSRLNIHDRVLYRIEGGQLFVEVFDITAHKY